MDLNALSCFLEIAQRGNLTEAAKALHISQSSLSTMMKNLEDEVGCPLFLRSGNKALRLSGQGKIFAETARQILQRQQESLSAISRAGTVSGAIHIGVQAESDGLIFLLSQLHKKYPQVSFHLHSMRATLEDYLNSAMDFYVLPAEMKGGLPSISIANFGSVYAIVSTDHPMANRRVLRLEELAGERFAFALTEDNVPERTHRYCLDAGFTPDVAFLCDDIDHLLELARHARVVLITHNTFRQFRRSLEGLAEIPIDQVDVTRRYIYLAWPQEQANPLARFLAKDILQSYPNGVTRPDPVQK